MHMNGTVVWIPETEQEREMVRQQMNRLLETSHFRNSRRYPALFRFIVEEALAGRGEYLKERLIGVRVFGRPADYDTAADPVVRVTIAEIRKRIAQYYHDDGHDLEMRIELTPGSYEPEFRPGREGGLPHLHEASHAAVEFPSHDLVHSPASTEIPPSGAMASPGIRAKLTRRKHWATAVAALVLTAGGSLYMGWRATRPTAVDELWSPIIAPHSAVTLVLPMAGGKFGDNTQPDPASGTGTSQQGSTSPWSSFLQLETGGENVVFSDVTAMLRISNLLSMRHAETRPKLNDAMTLEDLRQGPAVLIGGMDNQWTLRVLSHLRYGFNGSDRDAYWIQDHKDPNNRRWSLDLKMKIPSVTGDYAIIARVHDQATGQPEIIAAGIGMSGTAAAGEFLVSATGADELRRRIGDKAFRDRDFEAVLGTDVVNGVAGSARILAVDVPER